MINDIDYGWLLVFIILNPEALAFCMRYRFYEGIDYNLVLSAGNSIIKYTLLH
jgi:hypothetical protein